MLLVSYAEEDHRFICIEYKRKNCFARVDQQSSDI